MSDLALPSNPSRKEFERHLDTQASPLDVETDLRFRDALAVVMRAVGYIKIFPLRFGAKFFLMWLSLLTPLILPWPIKIVIDNVILGQPVAPDAFPATSGPSLRSWTACRRWR